MTVAVDSKGDLFRNGDAVTITGVSGHWRVLVIHPGSFSDYRKIEVGSVDGRHTHVVASCNVSLVTAP